jgi:hypothetical protein
MGWFSDIFKRKASQPDFLGLLKTNVPAFNQAVGEASPDFSQGHP